MKIIELFSGHGDISSAFAERGHEVFRVDYSQDVEAECHADVNTLTADKIIELMGGGSRHYMGEPRLHHVFYCDSPSPYSKRGAQAENGICAAL